MPQEASPPAQVKKAFFTNLFEKFYPIMQRQAISITQNSSLADDAIQDALLRVIDKYELLSSLSEPQLVFYIVKTVKCTSIDLLRKRSKESGHAYYCDTDYETVPVPDTDTPERCFEQNESHSELAVAVERLPEEARELLLFKYVLAQSNAELATRYQTSEDNIRQRLCRARRKLLQLMMGGGVNE